MGVNLSSKKHVIVLFLILSAIFCYPVLKDIGNGNWGIADWDQHLLYNGVPRRTVLEFGQFPLWNPYYCGGNVMLANPQSAFLSPLYLVVLLFGEVIGLKLLIMLSMAIGLFGMWLLAKEFGFGRFGRLFSAVLYMLGGVYAEHMAIGHTTWMPMALIPYVVFFYLKALKKWKYGLVSGLFLAFIFLGGGIYPFYYSVLFLTLYAVIEAARKKKIVFLSVLIMILLSSFLIGAVKFIPSIEFTNQFGGVIDEDQPNSISVILTGLLSRDQEVNSRSFKGEHFDWEWQEYGSYIGIIPLLLIIGGCYLVYKKWWNIILIALVSLWLSLGPGFLQSIPLFNRLHVPSRFILLFLFCAAILIGAVVSILEKKEKIFSLSTRSVLLGVLIVVVVDLVLVNGSVLKDAFVVEQPEIHEYSFTQADAVDVYKTQYSNFLRNLGTVDCYERVHPEIKAVPIGRDDNIVYDNYIGEAYIAPSNIEGVEIDYFSPNNVVVKSEQEGVLVLNQNYLKGWRYEISGEKYNALDYNGLIAAKINKRDSVSFYYWPTSFVIGLVVSLMSLVVGVVLFLRSKGAKKDGE